MVILLSYLISDFQRSSTYCYRYTAKLSFRGLILIALQCLYVASKGEPIYLFGVLRRFQHCTGHITMGSWKGRGNQYIQSIRVLYCKLPTKAKQLPAFPLEAMLGIEPRPQRWEARVLPLCHRGTLGGTKVMGIKKGLRMIRLCN